MRLDDLHLPAATSLTDHLARIEGLDARLALRHARDQEQLLARVLRRFVASYRQGLPTLLDSTGDEHDVVLRWRTTCHSARGALAVIGASALVEQTTELERALGDLAPRASLLLRGRRLHEDMGSLAGQLATALAIANPDGPVAAG